MPITYDNENISIVKIANMGPLSNNGYILSCRRSSQAIIIDAPANPQKLTSETGELNVQAIIITHRHPDHTAGLNQIKKHTRAPFGIHPDDSAALQIEPDFLINHGESIRVGDVVTRVIHTPGHTAGAICVYVDGHLFSGDTLFQGGPGRTDTPVAFRQVKYSIKQWLLDLPEDTVVHTGHGPDTTIRDAKHEIDIFDSRSHPDNLCGDINWLKS